MKYSWVCHMADILVREILGQMCKIHIDRGPDRRETAIPLDAVCGDVDGEYQMQLEFRAEPGLFKRLTENMMGTSEDMDVVRESAREFFNTLCGRFISEIYRATGVGARFYPVQYEPAEDGEPMEWDGPVHTISFISDKQEYAEFSWTQGGVEDLLKRSEAK